MLFIKSQVAMHIMKPCFASIAESAVSHPSPTHPPRFEKNASRTLTRNCNLHADACLLLTRKPRVGAKFCEKRNLKCCNGQLGSKTMMCTHMINTKICAPTARCSQYARTHASGFGDKGKQFINTRRLICRHIFGSYISFSSSMFRKILALVGVHIYANIYVVITMSQIKHNPHTTTLSSIARNQTYCSARPNPQCSRRNPESS